MDCAEVAPMNYFFSRIGKYLAKFPEQPCGKTGGCRQIGEVFLKER